MLFEFDGEELDRWGEGGGEGVEGGVSRSRFFFDSGVGALTLCLIGTSPLSLRSGIFEVAEITSRMPSVDAFIAMVVSLGFTLFKKVRSPFRHLPIALLPRL